MKKWIYAVLALMLFVLPTAALAEVPPAPKSDIYVQDYANVLSAQTKAKIDQAGKAMRQKTKAQVVVVTVPTLGGAPIDSYSLELLRTWGIGDRELNNGVVLLVAVEDKQSRIEVGYGLEGALPDGKTGRIQDEFMLSYFSAGDYDGGILNGYMALAQEVMKEYKTASADIQEPTPKAAPERSIWDAVIEFIGVGIVVILVILDFVFFGGRFTMLTLSMLGRRGGGGGGYGGGSGGGGGSSRRW